MSERSAILALVLVLCLSICFVGQSIKIPNIFFDAIIDTYDELSSMNGFPEGTISLDIPSVDFRTPVWTETNSFDPFKLYSGDVAYFENGVLHNVHGPAIERTTGEVEYWLWGVKQDSYFSYIQLIERTRYLENKLRGIRVKFNGYFFEPNEPPVTDSEEARFLSTCSGMISKCDGPPIEYSDGSKWYMRNGKFHRLDGPAIILAGTTNDYYEYWIDGEQLTEDEFHRRVDEVSRDESIVTSNNVHRCY